MSGSPTDAAGKPGDKAPPGTPGTGDDLCPRCHGTGRFEARPCPDCNGTGTVTEPIGGA
ncbi:hypothetical protein [uncultured Methylobacterium sp.]|jgi:hypothetical protein|uniref:hypothetical protein n=1 Tax=uncultured Methylobacterium sp. TaxID=157278 RepID=UPI0026134D39|nr:hypothetical protein [uncultured Methylobacterium sp.]